MEKKFDIVVPVGPGQIPIVSQTISGLIKHINPGKIYIVSSLETFSKINSRGNNNIQFLNEDAIVEGLNLHDFKKYFVNRIGNDKRAAWYFQQFLKMGIAHLDCISECYLVWDADCVLVNKLSFLDKEKTFVTKTYENHIPYFDILKKLLNIDKQVDFSFISEHFLFRKDLMQEMISEISKSGDKPWYIEILDKIDSNNLDKSGFSEYETYGNYVAHKYPESFIYRELSVLRYGGKYCGMMPTKLDLWLFSLVYAYVSFETWTEKVYSRRKLISLIYKEYRKR